MPWMCAFNRRSKAFCYSKMRLSLSEGEVNAGHHLYMGGHADEMEQLLRDAFPGQSEDFYNYGKWAGGGYESDEFKALSMDERLKTYDYLKQTNLAL